MRKMFLNFISLVAILVTEVYSQGFSHGLSQSHNHAYSSQSITMHHDHQEPVYYHPDPYNDEFEENNHLIDQNHHLPDHRNLYNELKENNHQNHNLPDHRHLYNEQTENDHLNNHLTDHRTLYNGQSQNYHQNHHLIHQNNRVPNHQNVYNGQPIVVTSDYKGIPFKGHQNYKQMSFKHQKAPFHIKQDLPLIPHYNMLSNPFEDHEMPAHHRHRTPIKLDSHKHSHHHVNRIPHREYEFNYNIEDELTGDHKAHHETRNDGVVKGVYSFQEADGSIRIVEYTADAKNGFHAKVRHEGQKHKVPKHHKNYSKRPRYHPQHNDLHPLSFDSPKY